MARPETGQETARVPLRVPLRVRPGAARTAVGGRHGGANTLVVAVTARAVDGAATEAALRALAAALGVRRRAVRLVSGATSRTKVVEVDADPRVLGPRLRTLLDARPRSR